MATLEISKDYTNEVLMLKNAAVIKALVAIGIEAEKNAKIEITKKVYDKEQTPEQAKRYKRTGRLRNSITNTHDGNTVYIGTNVEYAPYVELGTYKMDARPFLAPAIEDHIDEYKEIFLRILENA